MRLRLVAARGANGLARDNDLDPPVLLPARGRIIAGHRIGGSHSHGSDRGGIQSLLHQEGTDCIGPLPREFEIELITARAVGVAGNLQCQTRVGQDPDILARARVAGWESSYLPDAKSTSAMVTTKPRGVSTVCSTAFS